MTQTHLQDFSSPNPKQFICDRAGFSFARLEEKIRQSDWWMQASQTVDCHHSNNSGVMLTHHLESVYEHVGRIFQQPAIGFYARMFSLMQALSMDPKEVEAELKIVALLHDIGKLKEDKSVLMAHPITGKPAHRRHGIVGLMAAMEIIGADLETHPPRQLRIYRTIELHDISYGLFREFNQTGSLPQQDRWTKINHKIHSIPAAGLMYLLLFKLADIHGHHSIHDVVWFYETVQWQYFQPLGLELPIPTEKDIRK